MSKTNWKIVYTDYRRMEKKAVEYINAGISELLCRDTGRYVLRVIPCVQELPGEGNVILIGQYRENREIRNYVAEAEVPQKGYLLRVLKRKEEPGCVLVIITAFDAQDLFYGAVDFINDYLTMAAPKSGGLRTRAEVFEHELPEYSHASSPMAEKRSVFAWGHTINNYRRYIERMAEMKLNQLILWNDFLPINAKDVVDYAHEYGIELIWGFPWGWSTNCSEIDLHELGKVKEQIVSLYKNVYCGAGDGIYFQSFTELDQDRIGGRLIAEAVADFVNDVSAELYRISPELHIQFGLHATSVRDHLEYIGKVDPRIEIVWEDCGAFPYSYTPVASEEDYLKAEEMTGALVRLREVNPIGLVYKGVMTQDWQKFVHQAGPYILGMASEKQQAHDREMLRPIWRYFQSEWCGNGKYVWRLSRKIHELTGGKVNLNMAAAMDGGMWLPVALMAELMWNCEAPYEEIFDRVAKRPCITMA